MSEDDDKLAGIVLDLQERADDVDARSGKWNNANAYVKGLSFGMAVLVLVIGLYIPHLQSEEGKNQEFRERITGQTARSETKIDMILLILKKEVQFITTK